MCIAIKSHNMQAAIGLCWKMLQLNTPKALLKYPADHSKVFHFQGTVERFRLQMLYELSVGDFFPMKISTDQ